MKKNTRQSKSKFYAPLAVLVFCLTMIAVSRGMGETYGVFLLPISETFQWNRASVTSVFSIYMVSFGLGSFLSGIVFDRLGPKFNYIIGLLMLASCYGFAGRLESLPAFCLIVGVCGGVGSALVGIVPTQSLIARWFKRRRATAMSIAYSGQGLGVMLLAPAAQIAIDAYGWKGAYELASLGFIGCFTVIVLMPWRRIANGAIAPAASPLAKDRDLKNKVFDQNIKPAIKELSLREAIRRPEFWGFFTIFGATAISVVGISLQTVAYLIDQGFEPVFAAFSFGLSWNADYCGHCNHRHSRRAVSKAYHCHLQLRPYSARCHRFSLLAGQTKRDLFGNFHCLFWAFGWSSWPHSHHSNG